MTDNTMPSSQRRRDLLAAVAGVSMLAATSPVFAQQKFSLLKILCTFAPAERPICSAARSHRTCRQNMQGR